MLPVPSECPLVLLSGNVTQEPWEVTVALRSKHFRVTRIKVSLGLDLIQVPFVFGRSLGIPAVVNVAIAEQVGECRASLWHGIGT